MGEQQSAGLLAHIPPLHQPWIEKNLPGAIPLLQLTSVEPKKPSLDAEDLDGLEAPGRRESLWGRLAGARQARRRR
jgi:hypothetical protein